MKPNKPCKNRRRTFCQGCIGGMAVASVGMVTFPVASFVVVRPQRVGGNKPVEVPLDQLVDGQVQYGVLRGQQIIILGTDDQPRVFNASCPHLGCNVIWDTAESSFRCPCHGAIFNAEGQVVSGPVSSPLQALSFEIKEDKVVVS